jgi:hypothetical protein
MSVLDYGLHPLKSLEEETKATLSSTHDKALSHQEAKHFKNEPLTKRLLERASKLFEQLKHQALPSKRADFSEFKAEFEAKNPALAKKLQEELPPPVERLRFSPIEQTQLTQRDQLKEGRGLESTQKESVASRKHNMEYLSSSIDEKPPEINSLLLKFIEMELAQEKNFITLYTLKDHSLQQEMREKIILDGKALDNFAGSLLANPTIKRELEETKTRRTQKIHELGGYIAIKARLQDGSHNDQDISVLLQQINRRAQSYKQSLSQKQHRGRTQ